MNEEEKMDRKVVITAAITGAIHTPTMPPYLPITPEEIANQAIEAAKEGAAEVHIHARDPQNGHPSSDLSLFSQIMQRIRNKYDAIICLTTGGGMGMTVEERLSVVSEFKPELASLNMGSMKFGMFPLVGKFRDWKYDWGKAFLESSRDFIFPNTYSDFEKILGIMRDSGTKPELEVYDVGHLYNLSYLKNVGLLNKSIYISNL